MLYDLRNLTKTYGLRTVLDIDTLKLPRGRVVGLLGPNGAGKTTLLEILSFLIPPSRGRIIYRGREVLYNRQQLLQLRREVVLVPQTPILFTTSVYKNLEFGLKIRKVPGKERRKMIEEVLELAGLQDMASYPAQKLSGGETQRVAIARALVCSPQTILFDEPTSNVDVENQAVIENIIQDINRDRGISIILTTHNYVQAAKLAEETIFLHQGRPAASVCENLFTGKVTLNENGSYLCLGQGRLRLPVEKPPNGSVKVAIDPKAVSVLPQGIPVPQGAWSGRIIQLTYQGEDVRLLLDVGVPLSALMNLEKYRQVRFAVGDEVWVSCPRERIEFLN